MVDSITLDPVTVTATPTPTRGPPPPPDAEELLIVTGGMRLSGWTGARITAGVELFPRHFDIETTKKYPGEVAKAIVTPRAPCQVYLRNSQYQDKFIDGLHRLLCRAARKRRAPRPADLAPFGDRGGGARRRRSTSPSHCGISPITLATPAMPSWRSFARSVGRLLQLLKHDYR